MRDSRDAYKDLMQKDIEALKAQNYQLRLSLRDYFAAAALTGYLTETANPDNSNPEIVAKWCYANADAMLEAREAQHE